MNMHMRRTAGWLTLLSFAGDARALRSPLRRGVITTAAAGLGAPQARAFEAAPAIGSPFEWTALWGGGATAAPEPKRTGLKPSEIASMLESDLTKGRYILTGALTPSIFADDCSFQDPNNAVTGLSKYRKALSFLFEPSQSTLENVRVTVSAAGDCVFADYTASGVLKLPWHPRIDPWEGHIVYSFNEDGLIASQVDVWNSMLAKGLTLPSLQVMSYGARSTLFLY